MLYVPGVPVVRRMCLLLACMICLCCAGCTAPSPKPSATQALPTVQTEAVPATVFSNGSAATDGPWISMDPVAAQEKGVPFAMTGSTNLPAKSVIEVIIVPSGFNAAKIHRLDDCIVLQQKCVLYFARAKDAGPGPLRWNITTDESMDIFRNTSTTGYTAIVENAAGNLSARTRFTME